MRALLSESEAMIEMGIVFGCALQCSSQIIIISTNAMGCYVGENGVHVILLFFFILLFLLNHYCEIILF